MSSLSNLRSRARGRASTTILHAGFGLALFGSGCSALLDTDPAKLGAALQADGGQDSVCAAACDDGVECTIDECDAKGNCVFRPSAEACDDGVGCTEDICNPKGGCEHEGRDDRCEYCAPGSHCDTELGGCVGATSLRNCDDNDPCTKDACVVADMMCASVPFDGDKDGHPATSVDGKQCRGGDDCDDERAGVYPGAEESCNGRDDNCNDDVDEACVANPDSCASPSPVVPSPVGLAVIEGKFAPLSADFDVPCGDTETPDAVYLLELKPGVQDVVFEAVDAPDGVVLAVGTSCDGSGFRLGCAEPLRSGRTRLALHRYDPVAQGDKLYLLVDAGSKNASGAYRIDVKVTQAAPDTCTASAFDHTGCGTLVGFMAPGAGQLVGGCLGIFGQRTPAEAVVRVSGTGDGIDLVATSDDFGPVLYARDSCGPLNTEFDCDSSMGGPGSGQAEISLDLGNESAYVVIDNGGTAGGQSYTLTCSP